VFVRDLTNEANSAVTIRSVHLARQGSCSDSDSPDLGFESHAKVSHGMPQDPNLYGQRPAKKQKRETAISSSLSFTSQLSSLLAADKASGSSSTGTNRAKPLAKTKHDLFKKKGKDEAKSDVGGKDRNKLNLKDPVGTEDDKAERARARRKMEAKARLYAAMKRGDFVAKEGEMGTLVDFDRKWAEAHGDEERLQDGDSSSGDDHSTDDEKEDTRGEETIIEYEDEFGRLRRGILADKQRLERRLARGVAAAEELATMSVRPQAPEQVIIGDAVQTGAFQARDFDAMEALARKRDRSATPPEMKHYEADKEVRTRGVAFYQFSKDEERRKEEMAALERERENTERVRQEKESKVAARKKEIEERRKEMAERRAKKMADSFLDGLGKDFVGSQ
jgi:hypothetical protein